jgi:hypothetical protein
MLRPEPYCLFALASLMILVLLIAITRTRTYFARRSRYRFYFVDGFPGTRLGIVWKFTVVLIF